MELKVLDYIVFHLANKNRKTTAGYTNYISVGLIIEDAEKELKIKISDKDKFKLKNRLIDENVVEYIGELETMSIIANSRTYEIVEKGGYLAWNKENERLEKLKRDALEASLKNAIKDSKLHWITIATLIVAILSLISGIVAIFYTP